jgi:hypothetical protein
VHRQDKGGAANKTSVESMAQNDFQEVKRCKRHNSNDTSQTVKKSAKPVPTSTAVKLPPKAVLTRNFFTPLRTTDLRLETTGAGEKLLELKAPRKSSRLPPKNIKIIIQKTTILPVVLYGCKTWSLTLRE